MAREQTSRASRAFCVFRLPMTSYLNTTGADSVDFCPRTPSVVVMGSRPLTAVAVVVVLVLAGCSAGYQTAPEAPEPSDPPADPAEHPGYYDGYWHNDTFDVNPENGLTDAEVEAIVDRAMARVQLIRGLRFDADVEVELVTREEFQIGRAHV